MNDKIYQNLEKMIKICQKLKSSSLIKYYRLYHAHQDMICQKVSQSNKVSQMLYCQYINCDLSMYHSNCERPQTQDGVKHQVNKIQNSL